ncbi:Bug family tripartite tricarboxylate transporter substrate binding protein [Stella sp.]|uniref:Bug family tripartite tricarboxylate transporter substrate binding protein n=1 Tax=Stella sp. TaxID=2912054 RepID=UPI0035AEA186
MLRRSIAAAALVAGFAGAAAAADFPSRDIRFLCGFSAGGSCDLVSRMFAEKLGPIFGQNVVVENKTGASGMIALTEVSRGAPDGHLVTLSTMANHTVLPQMPGVKLAIDPNRDVTPIASLANVYNMLIASPQAPFQTVPELIRYAKANPGKLTYASVGNGSSQHLAGALFQRLTGTEMLHVPYRGGANALVDITAGRTDLMFGNMPEFLGQIAGKGVRAIAFGAAQASPLFPDLPLVSQTVPEFKIGNWFGLVGPAKLPPEIVAKWVAALEKVAADPDFQQRMAKNGLEIIVGPPARLEGLVKTDLARWGEVIRGANIRAE